MNKKVFIGTLYIGENEKDECLASISRQSYPSIDHKIISYLPNKEAHDKLYHLFMSLQNEYDYFIKLDADMVLLDSEVIERMVSLFISDSNLDHAVFTVHDWYSNSDIIGLHMFSNRVYWPVNSESLFVDYDPIYNGKRMIVYDSPSPVALHSPNPHLKDAYMFGFHRTLKIIQTGRFIKNLSQIRFQFSLINKAWCLFLSDRSLIRFAVILGSEDAFSNPLSSLHSKHCNVIESYIVSSYNDSSIKNNFFYNSPFLYSCHFFLRKIRYYWFNVFIQIPFIFKRRLLSFFNS